MCELHFCPAMLVDCSLGSWRKRIQSIILHICVITLGHNTDNDYSNTEKLAHLYFEPTLANANAAIMRSFQAVVVRL